MISHRYRCIFIHQRKAAGSSIKASFQREENLSRLEQDMFSDGVINTNPPWSEARRLYPEYITFAVVRNPWDRAISGWRYCESTKSRELLEVLEKPPQEGHDFRHFTRAQADLVTDPGGRLAIDFVLRFENLQEDYDTFCEKIGRPRNVLGRLRAGGHSHYKQFYDSRSIAVAAELFRKDIALFGYAF